MATFNELVEAQSKTGETIQHIIRNFKKDPADRKTTFEYFDERLRRLSEAWDQFESQDLKLRTLVDKATDHEYFTNDYYAKISDVAQTYLEIFTNEANRLRKIAEARNTNPRIEDTGTTLLSNKTNHQAEDSNSHQGLIRKISARMTALERLLHGITCIEEVQPRQYYEIRINTINNLWSQLQGLCDDICEKINDPLSSGFDINRFYEIGDKVQEHLVNLSVMAKKVQNIDTDKPIVSSQTQSPLHLPKMTIPKFDGDYLKWQQFHDLFSEMVDNQSIPAIQKMWYLKTNLSGEAEHLISQFSLSEENYDAAWKTLQERYNNKRILVSNLVDKILNQPSVMTSSAASMKSLHDTTKECLMALNNLGIITSSWDAILMQLLIRKLDKNIHIRFMQSLTKPKEVPMISELLSFLELQFQAMEAITQKDKPTNRAVSTIITSNVDNNSTCKLCNNIGHKLYHCNKFRQLSEAERLRWIQSQKLCVNCFGSNHSAKTCNSGNCRKCAKKHNTLLHLEKKPNNSISGTPSTRTDPKPQKNPSTTNVVAVTSASNVAAGRQGYVLLATARVIITASNGVSGEFRAVLDSGSQVNIVSKRLCQRLSMSPSEASLCLDVIGETQKRSKYRINIGMKSRDLKLSTNLEAYVLPTIIPPQPSQQIDISTWDIPNNIKLADPQFNQPEKIDILLGAEFYYRLTRNGTIHLAGDLPTLQNTALGWIVGGAIGQNSTPNPICTLTCAIFANTSSVEEAIEQLWKLDEIESTEKNLSPLERQCESHFNHNTRTTEDGRFIVSLPFRENPAALGESHTMAYNRFISLEHRLQKSDEIRKQYVQFMREYEQLGHMQRVNPDTILEPKYFIPHHCVFKPDSTTTKLRVVFDASAKTSTGHSLNDLMFNGPTVQSELFSILLRFRLPKFVFTTDIEKMYRQILIHPDNHQFQLIIWRENPSLPINYYKLNTITYGTRAAPYLATNCLRRIADENIITYPYGSQLLRDNFYVDDGLGGSDSLNIAIETQKELIMILKKHGFNLKKWCGNHPQLLRNIPLDDQEVDLDFNGNNDTTVKTLGLLWLPKTDCFCVKVKINPLKIVSKRSVTSDLARLFDPLGLVAPVVVKAKIFIQQLWQLRLDWDEPLPKDLQTVWNTFRTELDSLNNLQILRHIFKGYIPVKTQLHVFADASEKAFGAAVYIRATLKDGRVIVRLLCSKTRVAPLKQQTLPRLELCAAVIAAQLAHRVKIDTQMKDQPVFLWTDSEIVLSWINAQSSTFHTFVANRVAKIQALTLPNQWRHVRSKDNPADVLSRGLSAVKLSSCDLWFYGPLFLHGKEEMWPPSFSSQLHTPTDIEKRKIVPITAITIVNDDFVYTIPHRNSFKFLQRILGYILRFIKNTRMRKQERPICKSLTTIELDDALFLIIRTIQASDFSAEVKQLQKHNGVDKNSSISSLSPFLDERRILRVGGRLAASTLQYDAKHPMLISYNDPLAKLLFIMTHEENKHCGPQALLNIMRQRFWPVKGKIIARSTVQKCIRCTRARPQLCKQIMGNLPQTRVAPARPFINTGVDYCGPFWIHYRIRGKRPTKAYIAVFCCFATKAVHLEVVSDLSTEAFLGALKRFIGRRGRCQNIYSDNATNFIGARNQLSELYESIYSKKGQEAIMSSTSSKGIQFHFIPPRAPHFGGLWEAAVKSAKHLLLRSVATATLTQEELETVVIEIEAILNSRPLTPLSNDPDSIEALTPGHFLIGEALTSQVDSKAILMKTSELSHWKLVSRLKQEFWKRWTTEYLNELQQRNKWKTQSVNFKIGDMVIIKEDHSPVMKWPLGRVVQVHPGDDGVVRVAEVKTATGLFKRSIHRLALLPVETNNEQEEVPHNHPDEPTNTNEAGSATNQSDSREEPKTKKRKITKHHLNLVLVITLFMLPIVFGTPVEIKRFGTKAGIHFEHLGTITLSNKEWNLLVYYDLNTYWAETATLINGTKSLQKLCTMLTLNTSCSNIIDHFENMEGELQLDNRLLRGKRGAVDIVGNIAHSLFGILDSEYANQMSNTILQVKENESYLLQLLKNQTSVIDSTINVMRQNQFMAKARFEQLEREIKLYSEELTNINKAVLQMHLTQLFHSVVLQLELIANNLQKVQSSILNTLMDTQHGKISPSLLTPEQLQNAITQIKLHLSPSLDLPVADKDDLLQLFKLLKVKGRLTQQHVVFKITLPLIEGEQFEAFYLTPVPNVMNGTMVTIKPCSTILGIATSREQYILLTRTELSSCDILKQDVFLCANIQTRYNYGSERCACEINLFNNKTTPTCTLENTTARWIPLNKRNQWIYATLSSSHATAVCNREFVPISLRGSGLLTLNPECMLKHEFVTISGRQTISSTVRSSYTSLGKISDIALPENTTHPVNNLQSISTNLEVAYTKNTRELASLQKSLENHDIMELPNKLKSHQEHSYAVGYLALSSSFTALIILLLKCRKNKTARNSGAAPSVEATEQNYELQSCQNGNNQTAPVALPRRFTLDV